MVGGSFAGSAGDRPPDVGAVCEAALFRGAYGLTPAAQRRLKLFVKAAVVAAVAWFVHGSIRDGWARLQELIEAGRWSAARLDASWLAAAAALYVVGQLPNGLFWRSILAALGQHVSRADVLRAFYLGHLGKYVPGKAMVVVMRTGLLAARGAHPAAVAVSVFYETLTMMAVGAVWAAIIIGWKYRAHVEWSTAALGMALVTALPTLPPVFRRIVGRLLAARIDGAAAGEWATALGPGLIARGWGIVSIGWLLTGLSVWATLRAAGFDAAVAPFDAWLVATAAAAFSVVAGFLSFIPGGFFVREAVLLTLLGPIYGEAGALVGAVLVRLVWIVAEVLVSVILYRARRGDSPRDSNPPRTMPAAP